MTAREDFNSEMEELHYMKDLLDDMHKRLTIATWQDATDDQYYDGLEEFEEFADIFVEAYNNYQYKQYNTPEDERYS